jgi:hypothetical protein
MFPFHFGNSPSDYKLINDSLKVDGNEKNKGGRGGHSNSGSVWHCGHRGLF